MQLNIACCNPGEDIIPEKLQDRDLTKAEKEAATHKWQENDKRGISHHYFHVS